MNDKVYEKPEPKTSEKQQIKMRLAFLNDRYSELEREKIDILSDIVKLETRYKELS